MPYQNKVTASPLEIRCTRVDVKGVVSPLFTLKIDNAIGTSGVMDFSRTGSNVNVKPKRDLTSLTGNCRYELRPVRLRFDKVGSFARKIWSKKLKRYINAYDVITVMRMVKLKSKTQFVKGNDLMPNALNFSGNTLVFLNRNTTLKVVNPQYVPGTYDVFTQTGDNWCGKLATPGSTWNLLTVNWQWYSTRGISDPRFAAAETAMNTKALNKFYEKAKNQSVNLLQAIAERKQTAKMLLQLLERAALTMIALKKGRLALAAETLFPRGAKEVANDILAIQFGLKPLLSDIDGVAKELAVPESIVFDVTSRSRTDLPHKVLHDVIETAYALQCRTVVTSRGFVEVKYKGRYRVNIVTRDFSRLGFGNLATIGWELTPWSFVVDWFIPIGNYINSLDAFSGLVPLFATKTVFSQEEIVFTRTFQGYSSCATPTGFVNTRVSCVRSILVSFPPIPLPSFKSPFSLSHLIDTFALLTQLSKRK